MNHPDTVVIGAGHNGLACATLLAKAGQKVLVLDAAPGPGGLAASRDFGAGFRAPVAHTVNHFPEAVAKALDLERHGLRWADGPRPLVQLERPGGEAPIRITGDAIDGVGDADQAAWRAYCAELQTYADALAPFWLKTMPRIAPGPWKDLLTFGHLGLNLRRMGKAPMREFLRVFSLPMRDLAEEHFQDEGLKALACWDGLIGGRMAPRSPNNAVATLLYRMAGRAVHSPANLCAALDAAAEAAGVERRYDSEVARIDIAPVEGAVAERGQALRTLGVTLATSEAVEAGRVISSADPKSTFLELVGAEHLEIGFTQRIQRLRSDGLVAKLHLGLSDLPTFAGLEPKDLEGRLLLAPTPDTIEFAFDDAKYGGLPERPVLEVTFPSLEDPDLAPDDQHVLSAHVMYVPRRFREAFDEDRRAAFIAGLVDRLDAAAPGLRDLVVAQELLTPADLEREHHLAGGHWHHGELALDQMLMMRPTYEAAQYATPIAGLWLCGAGCHPAGDLTGAAGHNAAQEILK